MTTMVIEKDVPQPNDRGTGRTAWPFGQMVVGDSFFTTIPDRNTVASAASRYGSRNNCRFTIRKVQGGFRVWRIA